MGRIRLILLGAVLGLTWAAGLRGYMMQLAAPRAVLLQGAAGSIRAARGRAWPRAGSRPCARHARCAKVLSAMVS